MSWRTIVITGCAKLDYQLGFLVVRKETTTKIHLDEIHTIMIDSTAVSMTTALMCEMIKQKIKVIFCDERHNPISELISYYGSHDTSSKVRKQIQWTEEQKKVIWTEIVGEKIRQQYLFLNDRKQNESQLLYQYLQELEIGDVTNREGHAAKVYFNALFGKAFSRAEDNNINAALNYGYAILLSCVNKEITANGYITQIGIFHNNMFNQYNLGSDLMEPFRPLIDRRIMTMELDVFEHDEKMQLVSLLSHDVIVSNRTETLANGIKIYVRSVFDALNENDPSLIRFCSYEL